MPSGIAIVLGRWLDRSGWGSVRHRVGSFLAKPQRGVPEPPRLRLETPAGELVATPVRLPGETVLACALRTHPGRKDIMLCATNLAPRDPADTIGDAEVLVVVVVCPKTVWQWHTNNLVKNNKLGKLRWAIARGYPWSGSASLVAADHGHLELLQWAIAHGCGWHPGTSYGTAKEGHLKLLRWAITHGCEWDPETSWRAAKNGRLKLLRWALANGCPTHPKTRSIALERCHTEVVEWLDARVV